MDSPSTSTKPIKKGPTILVQSYLLVYNALQTVGWTIILFQALNYYANETNANTSLYESVKWPLLIFQNAALLEVVHAVFRIVPSSPTVALQQISSRLLVVCGTMVTTVAARETIGFPLCIFSYSFNEIIRYGYYALNIVDGVPYILLWLRYTTFIVVYPLGFIGECLCLYFAQEEMATTKLWSIEMPNLANMIFYFRYIVILTLVMYLPLFLRLYIYMFGQRKKVLGVPKTINPGKKLE